MKKTIFAKTLAIAALALAFNACSDDDDDAAENAASTNQSESESDESAAAEVLKMAFISANADDANYVMTVNSLSEGSATVLGNGLETTTGTEWFTINGKYLYRLQYNQQNSGATSAYHLTEDGEMAERDYAYDIQRFSTFGKYDEFVITSASVSMDETDAAGNAKYGMSVTYLDSENQVTTYGDVIDAENYLGNGEYVLLSGLEQVGTKIFAAVIPQGLSAYGSADGDGKWIVDESLMTVADDGTKTLAYTQYPDECWIAMFEGKDLKNPTLIKTDKLSYACGRMKSQYYQTIWADDDENLYVFSNGYSRGLSIDSKLQTTHTAGVMRIKAGETDFDSSYGTDGVVDLESQLGLPFYRLWHMSSDYFLLQLYYSKGINYAGTGATKMAIYCGSTQKLVEGEGLPDPSVVSGFSKHPFTADGLTYITVQTSDGNLPAVYIIDPTTATATKGLEVECTEISCVGILEATKE